MNNKISGSNSVKSENVSAQEEDFLDIDIDISMGEERDYSPQYCVDANGMVEKATCNLENREIKQELIDEASRNPKRKHSIVSLDEDMAGKSPKEWSSGNFGDDVLIKEVFCSSKERKDPSAKDKENKDALQKDNGKPFIKEEPFEADDMDDHMFSTIDIKQEPNTTFSQVEEVIDLDSDEEDLWCSTQLEMATPFPKNIKQEPIEINDSFSLSSLDSPPHFSPKDDILKSNVQTGPNENDSDDDVIFLECDNKKLDLDDSQMGLFEKIRKNIKVKKEKVDSQPGDTSHVDVIDLASPPKGLSPISMTEDDTKFDHLSDISSVSDKIDPFPEPYSPTDDLPDLVFTTENKRDLVSRAPEASTHEPISKNESKDVIHSSSSRPTLPISPIKKRPIQLIEPLPQPPKKYARRLSSSTLDASDGDKVSKESYRDSKSYKDSDRDKWRSSHKSASTNFSTKDKEIRAEALKEIELRKKEQKLLGTGAEDKTSASSSKPALPKVKTSKPKLLKLVNSLEEDESVPRQPVRKAHKPKNLPPSFGHAKKKITSNSSTSSKHSTKDTSKSTNNSHQSIQTSHLRTTAETTVDQ